MQSVSKRLKKLYVSTKVVEFGPLSLKSIRQTLIDEQHSRVWINRQINRIRRIFKWGVENEIVPAAILQALQAVAPLKKGRSAAREMPPVKPVPEEHVTAVLPYVSPQVAAMIRLLENVLGFTRAFSGGLSIRLNLDLSAKPDTRHC